MKIIRDAKLLHIAVNGSPVTSLMLVALFFNTNKEISVYSVFVSLMVVALAKG